ncbi:methyl-accepting chemotaxis protein [Bifidobacterium avesanii]|nr:methyl-accepting chemotaxis protein [Bifidobacterium avesanii]
MERLRPVYETGVLRLLLRQNSMVYVALLRSSFDPLTGELTREVLEDRLAQGLRSLIASGDYTLADDQSVSDAAHAVLVELTREGDGDYAWLANSLDVASHRFLYRLTARAHRAIEALSRLEDDAQTLSGAQANSIIMEIEHARIRLTADPRERIALLNREIKANKREIKRILNGEDERSLNADQVEDIIAVVHNTLRGVPIDLRELALKERDNGDMLRRRMQSGDMSVDEILTSYHDDYRRSYRESDAGRRFDDAFQVIVTDEGRKQIDEAIRDIARTPYLDGEPSALLGQVRAELARIYDGIEDVRRQMRASDEAVSRLVRQQTDTRYRTMLGTLNRLFVKLNAEAKAAPDDDMAPYATDVSSVRLAGLPTRPARPMVRDTAPGLASAGNAPAGVTPDLRALIEVGGPRLKRMATLLRRDPVMRGGAVDMAASFNRLPADERRESELVGFLGAIRTTEGAWTEWHCVTLNGEERVWRTRPLMVAPQDLDEIAEES